VWYFEVQKKNFYQFFQHTVFDLTSKVIDYLVISEGDVPSSLVILSEEELVCVDLTSEGWPVFAMPYLNPVHASAITW
jgi:lethal(2) giant larvae protein